MSSCIKLWCILHNKACNKYCKILLTHNKKLTLLLTRKTVLTATDHKKLNLTKSNIY